jgi:hypothetical protein
MERSRYMLPEFLPEVGRAIDAALETVAAQEQALASLSRAGDDARVTRLERNRDRIFGLKSCVERPRQACADLDALLRNDENHLREYLKQIDGLRQRLADWAGGNKVIKDE